MCRGSPAEMSRVGGLSQCCARPRERRFAALYVVVGIFIVNNSPEIMTSGLFNRNLTVSTAGKSAQERSEWDDRFMRRVWLRLSSSSRAEADRVFGYCDR